MSAPIAFASVVLLDVGELLRVIQQNISHFKFLRTALEARLPDCEI
jgi:hypothetical protein